MIMAAVEVGLLAINMSNAHCMAKLRGGGWAAEMQGQVSIQESICTAGSTANQEITPRPL